MAEHDDKAREKYQEVLSKVPDTEPRGEDKIDPAPGPARKK